MDGIGTAGNFSNRAHQRVQHSGIAGPDASLRKSFASSWTEHIADYLKGNCPTNRAKLIPIPHSRMCHLGGPRCFAASASFRCALCLGR